MENYIQRRVALDSLPIQDFIDRTPALSVTEFLLRLGCDIRSGGIDAVPYLLSTREQIEVNSAMLTWMGLAGPFNVQMDAFLEPLQHHPDLRPCLKHLCIHGSTVTIKTAAVEILLFSLHPASTIRTWRHVTFIRMAVQKYLQYRVIHTNYHIVSQRDVPFGHPNTAVNILGGTAEQHNIPKMVVSNEAREPPLYSVQKSTGGGGGGGGGGGDYNRDPEVEKNKDTSGKPPLYYGSVVDDDHQLLASRQPASPQQPPLVDVNSSDIDAALILLSLRGVR